ncbi:hypothetical protein B0I21_103462 [Sphingobacterium paludis]|uniref:Uncharacterized protein n=1 Tax=Sphingobacterium paludis TaxID=1476465 RepID=A0A4R7D2F6_9SPHI|nr:hypothetical protein B0I21_103462 [Sphingobacterium paludis]
MPIRICQKIRRLKKQQLFINEHPMYESEHTNTIAMYTTIKRILTTLLQLVNSTKA